MAGVTENQMIDGRYRVKSRIGSGGMADVYCAEDQQLGREVALKVLHSRFARDEDFIERFRREASSAAKLQHPNVVNVFDRGDVDGTYYIAMEYLRGRSLKDIVSKEGPLPQERAVDLGIQILEAAGFAHNRGVIHRDFKPHNVIVDDKDTAKVTDFGIARAGASEMTETGSIMGTAHYLSPEQAQGHNTSPASDLYSIGIVLYEMLSGRLPFEGDSAVSIALQHVTESPPPLRSVKPDIHPEVEQAVMRALSKDPRNRYASADEFIAALRSARGALTGAGPGTAVFAPVPVGEPATAFATPPPEDPIEEEERRKRWPWILLGLLALGLLALVLFLASRPDGDPVPEVVGKNVTQASGELRRAGFKVKVERQESEEPVNRVIDQDPDGGASADKGSEVTLVTSSGPAQRTVPEVEGAPEKKAVSRLSKRGFRVEVDNTSSSSVPSGRAIRTLPPAGTELSRGARVRLLISNGPRQVRVPDVVGLTRSSAESQLEGAGLGVTVEETESRENAGKVVAQDPDGGAEVDEGARVTITVAKAPPEPEQVSVPSVRGDSEDDARSALGDAGFQVNVRRQDVDDEARDGEVLRQSPSGGEADRGSTVTIVVGRFKEPKKPADPPPDEGAQAPGPGAGAGAGGARRRAA